MHPCTGDTGTGTAAAAEKSSRLSSHPMADFKQPDFARLRAMPFTYPLFGTHLAKSLAPTLHNYIFSRLGADKQKYERLDSVDVPAFVEKLAANRNAASDADLVFNGSAVTMPHKATMTQHVDVVDANAKGVGAINTIYVRFRGGKALNIGTNTDTLGIKDAFLYNAPELVAASRAAQSPGLVYGGGGAGRAAVYALHAYLGCSTVYVVNRFSEEVDAMAADMKKNGFAGNIVGINSPEEAAAVEKPQLVVLAVPDFEPALPQEINARATLEVFMQARAGAVIEMCYNPEPITRLYRAFEAAGWAVIGGIEPMIYQGFAQQVLWTGCTVDEIPVKDVIAHVYSQMKQTAVE